MHNTVIGIIVFLISICISINTYQIIRDKEQERKRSQSASLIKMTKIKPVNGWTKETILQRIKERNNGTKCAVEGRCKYSLNMNHCFIGCFIPEDHPAMSYNKDVFSLVNKYPDIKEYLPFESIYDLMNFQLVHDKPIYRSSTYKYAKEWLNKNVE